MIWILAAALLLGVLYVGLRAWRGAASRSIGVRGPVLAADDSSLGSPILRSARLRLSGRPDHLVREGRYIIPVEQKPRARRVYRSHELQVGALCVLIEEHYRVRPPYGVVVIEGGREVRVPYDAQLEGAVHRALSEMRQVLRSGREPGKRWRERTCRSCGYNGRCWG